MFHKSFYTILLLLIITKILTACMYLKVVKDLWSWDLYRIHFFHRISIVCKHQDYLKFIIHIFNQLIIGYIMFGKILLIGHLYFGHNLPIV